MKKPGLINAPWHRAQCRLVKDIAAIACRASKQIPVKDGSVQELDGWDAGKVFLKAAGQIIQHYDGCTQFHERRGQVRTDKPRAAGNQNTGSAKKSP